MRSVHRALLAAALLVMAGTAAGCSRELEDVDDELWRQVDRAESAVYEVTAEGLGDGLPTEILKERLSAVAEIWEESMMLPPFATDTGTAVVYGFEEDAPGDSVQFSIFVTSGLSDHLAVPGGWGSRPTRVYTCYRFEAVHVAGTLWEIVPHLADGDDRWECPETLVEALEEGAQYRAPEMFTG